MTEKDLVAAVKALNGVMLYNIDTTMDQGELKESFMTAVEKLLDAGKEKDIPPIAAKAYNVLVEEDEAAGKNEPEDNTNNKKKGKEKTMATPKEEGNGKGNGKKETKDTTKEKGAKAPPAAKETKTAAKGKTAPAKEPKTTKAPPAKETKVAPAKEPKAKAAPANEAKKLFGFREGGALYRAAELLASGTSEKDTTKKIAKEFGKEEKLAAARVAIALVAAKKANCKTLCKE